LKSPKLDIESKDFDFSAHGTTICLIQNKP